MNNDRLPLVPLVPFYPSSYDEVLLFFIPWRLATILKT